MQAGDEGIRFLLVSGKPLEEPVAWYGPIVMNTQSQLQQAFSELREGTFLKKKKNRKTTGRGSLLDPPQPPPPPPAPYPPPRPHPREFLKPPPLTPFLRKPTTPLLTTPKKNKNESKFVILGGGMVAGYAAKQMVESGLKEKS